MTTAIGYSFADDGGLSKTAMEKLVASDQILADMADGSASVIVEFAMPQVVGAAAGAAAADEALVSTVHQKQDEILGRVFATEGGLSGALASDELGIKRMDFSPMFAVTVDRETLEKLAADPAVARIHEDGLNEPHLIQSLPLIGMPNVYAAGATGNGWTVAVLDTGARRSHEFLSSSVVSAACYGTSNGIAQSICPGGASASTDLNSAPDCNRSIVANCGHGTLAAGAAAGFNTSQTTSEPANGAARNSKLITINVFSYFPISKCGNNYKLIGCVLAYTSDMIKGFERVYALRNTYKIASVNVSNGGGSYSDYCDSDSRKPIIDLLRDAGIATVISAGNGTYDTSVSAPACISSAIAVASSTKSDARSSFSNWGSLIDVVAPGTSIYSSHVDGSSNSSYSAAASTSMAAAQVAGAFAALRSAKPAATVSQIEAALKATGVNIASAGTTKPRIKVDSALTYLGDAMGKAVIKSPKPGSALGPSAKFEWTAGTGVSRYWLLVGSAGPGSSNIYQANQGTRTSNTVTGLPSSGTLYVRLMSLINGKWHSDDRTYKTGGGIKAVMTSPKPGATIGSSITFAWSAGTNVTQYWLYVGSTGVNSSNVFNGSTGTGTSKTLLNLPATGTIYVRLFSLIGGAWQYNDYTYKAGGAVKAVITSPKPGSTLGPSATFEWSTGYGVTQYWLSVGSTGVGSYDIYQASQGTNKTKTVKGLTSSGTIYVRLYSLIGGAWQYNDYTYKAGGAVKAVMTSPSNGATLVSAAKFVWTAGNGVTEYSLSVGTTGAGSDEIYKASQGTNLSKTVTGLPTSGTIYVRLYSLISGSGWQFNDYTYTAKAPLKAYMSWPVQGSTLLTSETFFWMPGLGASKYWLYVGSLGAGSANIYQGDQGTNTSKMVGRLPAGTIHVRLWSLLATGWQYNDYVYSAKGNAKAGIISPTPGTKVGSSATFTWSAGTGVSSYILDIGTTSEGSTDVYGGQETTDTSVTVTGIPDEFGMIYVRLWSLIEGQWFFTDYTYSTNIM